MRRSDRSEFELSHDGPPAGATAPTHPWSAKSRRREARKYRLARFAQWTFWLCAPPIVVAHLFLSRDDRIYTMIAFGAVMMLLTVFLFMRCGICRTELYYDAESRAAMGPRISVFKPIGPACPGCGVPRA